MVEISKLADILKGKLENWLETLVAMLPNLLVAVLVIVAFSFLSKILHNIANRIFDKVSNKTTVNRLFANLIYFIAWAVGVIIALNVLHLKQTVTSLLAGAGIIGLALGFAFQDITANFISGVLIAFREPIKIGDIIKTDDFFGVVERISLRVTIIRTFDGLHVLIPNKEVFQAPIINFTKTNERRVDLAVGVSYGSDLDFVKKITLEAVSKLPFILENEKVQFFYEEFADSSINFSVRIWIDYRGEANYLEAKSELLMTIKRTFDEHDINIPFPIRTLDFGIRGGEKLSEMVVQQKNIS